MCQELPRHGAQKTQVEECRNEADLFNRQEECEGASVVWSPNTE